MISTVAEFLLALKDAGAERLGEVDIEHAPCMLVRNDGDPIPYSDQFVHS